MSGWNLKELSDFAKDQNVGKYALDLISSMDRAIDIYKYHMQLAKSQNDLLQGTTPREQFELVFTPEDKRLEIGERKLAIQANIQACIHSARAIHDLFSQLVNCLLLGGFFPIHACDINRVTQKLDEGALKAELMALLESLEFRYINAFVNTIKHRNLVEFGALVSFEEGRGGVQFKGFKYKGDAFECLWAEDVLLISLAVKNAVITAGCLLNECIEVKR